MKKFFAFVAAAMTALTMNAAAISVADAMAAGMALDSAATSEADYTVEGFVINAQPFSLSYGNQIWYMADAADAAESDFQAYGCVAIEGNDTLQVLNGDKVQLTGKLYKYWNKNAKKFIIEIKNGSAAFVSKAEGDHTIDKGIEQITVAKALEIGAGLDLGATSSKTYEIVGYISAMAGKDGDYASYGNQTYWIADAQGSTAASNTEGAFEVYRGKADEEVFVGYKVKVKTAIKNYNNGGASLIESETNAAVTILEKAEEEEIDYPEGVISCDSAEVLAKALADPTADNKTVEGQQVKVWGYVTYAYAATEKEGVVKQSAWLADSKSAKSGNVQGAYLQIASMDAAVEKGDLVEIEGTLAKYYKADDNIIVEVINGTMKKVGEQGIENVVLTEKAQKVMVDGVIYIIRDNKMYNVQGTQVR